jgi:LysR family nod box-dependent transcriptional activator
MLAEGHPSTALFSDRIVCVGCKENAALVDGISFEDFSALGHVIAKFGSSRVSSQDKHVLQELPKFTPRAEVITWSFSAIPYFLTKTNRITTTYEQMAKVWCELYDLKYVPVPLEVPTIQFSMQWHKYRDSDPSIQWLKRITQETADEVINP